MNTAQKPLKSTPSPSVRMFTLLATALAGIVVGLVLAPHARRLYKNLFGPPPPSNTTDTPLGCAASLVSGPPVDVLELQGRRITSAEAPADVHEALFALASTEYLRSRQVIEDFAARFQLAKDVLDTEDPKDTPSLADILRSKKITEKDIKDYFAASQGNYPEGTTLEAVAPEIRRHLEAMRLQQEKDKVLATLREKKQLTQLLRPPCGPQVNLELEGYPSRGSNGTSGSRELVQIVDYLSDKSRYLSHTVNAFAQSHASSVRLIDVVTVGDLRAPESDLAAGAYCAHQQGDQQFRDYQEGVFRLPARLAPESIKDGTIREVSLSTARDAGLDASRFAACMTSGYGLRVLKKTVEMLQRNGITTFPAYTADRRLLVVPDHPADLNDILLRTIDP